MATSTVGLSERETITLPAAPASVSRARAWLVSRASPLVADDRLDDLALVISEIATNAIRHGGTTQDVTIAATPKDAFLCVQVTDSGSGFVPSPGAMASDRNGGFGLYLVERLTRRWGMTREGGRTRVWFEFDYEGG